MIEKYERMTVAELKQKAKEFGLKNISGMKKQELTKDIHLVLDTF